MLGIFSLIMIMIKSCLESQNPSNGLFMDHVGKFDLQKMTIRILRNRCVEIKIDFIYYPPTVCTLIITEIFNKRRHGAG